MKFFDLNSPVAKFLTHIADLMLVNLLFLAFSLPIVTFGASLTALNFVTLQIVENKQPAILASFLKSFKQNLKQATILWGLVFSMGAVFFAWHIVIENMVVANLASFLRLIFYVAFFLFSMMIVYLFYLQAKFENTIQATLKTAFLMAIRHFLTTLLALLLIGCTFIIVFFYPKLTGYGLLFILGGFAFVSFVLSILMNQVFKQYIKEEAVQ